MKLIAAILLATAALTSAARASSIDDYETCWSEASTAVLNREGVSEASLKMAVNSADARCWDAGLKAGETGKEMRSYMEVQLYNANKVDVPQPKIEKVSGHQASTGWALYNARTGYLCQYPLDSEPMRQLISENRLALAAQKRGCMIVDKTIEVEKVRSWGDTMEVRYVNDKGQMVEAYTSARTFRTKAGWNEIGIE